MADLKKQFEAASQAAQKLDRRPDNDQLLELYALYKQGTSGDVQGSRPGLLDIAGRAKFDAWTKRKGMTRDAAMQAYVALVTKLQKAG